ncbi:unnamed protein product [Prunus armeniaca]
MEQLAELANKTCKYEELLREEQQKRNSAKGTYYKTPSSSIHLVEVESEEGTESSEEREVALAKMAKLKYPISGSDKATKGPEATTIYRRKAIETPHRLPKPEELEGRQLKLAEKPPSMTTNLFNQPQVNMVNLNWPEQKIGKLTAEASPNIGRRVTREANQRPKVTISAGVVLCSRCKCENDQTGLLKTGEQEDKTEEYREKRIEYDGELDEETKAFGAELESLLQGDLGINMVFILPEKFRAVEGQENTLEGDVADQDGHYHEMPGLDRGLPEHKLPMKEGYLPVK